MVNDMRNRALLYGSIVAAVAILAIVALDIFRPSDNTDTIGHIVAIATIIITGIIGFLRSTENSKKIDTLHEKVNGDLDARLADARLSAYREGYAAKVVEETRGREGDAL